MDDIKAHHDIEALIEGDAPGADRMAGKWASKNNIAPLEFPAKWTKYGRAAGPIRNKQMLDEGKPDFVIAFPGNSGTANMIKQALKARIAVLEVKVDGSWILHEK